MAVIGINYDYVEDGEPDYESVDISLRSGETKVFESGDFVKDWYDLIKYIIFDTDQNVEMNYSYSSSVDHFIMDGAPYESAYLDTKEGGAELSYEYMDDKFEFFVAQGEKPTWKEMKDKYDSKKS